MRFHTLGTIFSWSSISLYMLSYHAHAANCFVYELKSPSLLEKFYVWYCTVIHTVGPCNQPGFRWSLVPSCLPTAWLCKGWCNIATCCSCYWTGLMICEFPITRIIVALSLYEITSQIQENKIKSFRKMNFIEIYILYYICYRFTRINARIIEQGRVRSLILK